MAPNGYATVKGGAWPMAGTGCVLSSSLTEVRRRTSLTVRYQPDPMDALSTLLAAALYQAHWSELAEAALEIVLMWLKECERLEAAARAAAARVILRGIHAHLAHKRQVKLVMKFNVAECRRMPLRLARRYVANAIATLKREHAQYVLLRLGVQDGYVPVPSWFYQKCLKAQKQFVQRARYEYVANVINDLVDEHGIDAPLYLDTTTF